MDEKINRVMEIISKRENSTIYKENNLKCLRFTILATFDFFTQYNGLF